MAELLGCTKRPLGGRRLHSVFPVGSKSATPSGFVSHGAVSVDVKRSPIPRPGCISRIGRGGRTHQDRQRLVSTAQREGLARARARKELRRAPHKWKGTGHRNAARVPAAGERRARSADLEPASPVATGAEGLGNSLPAAIQLPSYLCDNARNVRPQPRIYRPTARAQRANTLK